MLNRVVGHSMCNLSRQVSKKLLIRNGARCVGRRYMSGHGPDISKTQAALYIIIAGGAFTAIGMYQASSMRNRIEAFETGKTIPFKTMTDEEFLDFKQKFQEIHSEE